MTETYHDNDENQYWYQTVGRESRIIASQTQEILNRLGAT